MKPAREQPARLPAPPDRAAEAAAELRELTREANGAVKDLRQILREARELRAGMKAEAGSLLEEMLNAHIGEISDALEKATDDVNKVIRNQEEQTRQHYSQLLGTTGQELISDTCAMILHLGLPSVPVAEWTVRLGAERTRHLDRGCPCEGCAGLGSPKVFVTTDPALAPEGSIVFDLRDETGGTGR